MFSSSSFLSSSVLKILVYYIRNYDGIISQQTVTTSLTAKVISSCRPLKNGSKYINMGQRF